MQWVCKARSWFLSLGYTLCLGSVLPRVLYAYRVVAWRPQTIKKVPWTPRAVKVLREVETPSAYQERPVLVEQCISDNEAGALALLFIPKAMLLLIGALAAWPARRLCIPLCNNTRNCALCLVIAAVMCIVEIPIIMHVRPYPNPFYGVTGLIIISVSAALLIIGVVPQIQRAQKCKKKSQIASGECNDIELRHENGCSRCECDVCTNPKRFRPQLASCSGPYSCSPVSQDWDYMVSGVPNRTKEGEPRIVTETVYIDPPGIPTAAAYTQTMQVFYNTAEIQTVLVRTQSACMITEPEPEVEKAEVTMQTEAEEPTPVAEVDTQTIIVKLRDSHAQTERAQLSNIHVQTDKAEMCHSQVQTDDPPAPPDIVSEESDTASVTSSMTSSPKLERKTKKKKFNVQPRIDTNLTSKRKELVAKSSGVTTPRLRLTTPLPYNASRSRDPSPARGANR
ncbi:Gamma-aminobutyric acid type B receptor subunit 1 [Desmophyllum pertusum]|uniref:Gamma-aminobutyric acid type B receptor subunit 1 n=1 Tax=Desmophyllum pertusum TaxID=174260 RepID=A0A9W9Z0X6_9CNID|nr:Gamma-aminobutyric acid type B receptor subunit 1 [Desmophyllum pertusum]